jgi:hypothetical protein
MNGLALDKEQRIYFPLSCVLCLVSCVLCLVHNSTCYKHTGTFSLSFLDTENQHYKNNNFINPLFLMSYFNHSLTQKLHRKSCVTRLLNCRSSEFLPALKKSSIAEYLTFCTFFELICSLFLNFHVFCVIAVISSNAKH